MAVEKYIPIKNESGNEEHSKCEKSEPYALMVLGDSMLPEFAEGDVIVIEPDGAVKSGSFVIAYHNEEYIFRQVVIKEGRWYLQALNEGYPVEEIEGPEAIKGVITQKKSPGGRRMRKSYV